MLLPPSGAPCLPAPIDDPDGPLCRSCDVVHPGEEAVDGARMPQPRVVHEGAFPVLAVADRLELDPKMFGHDLRADPIQRVVPRKRPELCPGSVPPQDAHCMEPR